ncbi:hypothetical protein [Corynebacterium rouxii]|uniref:Uncharacterized protein n=1 Tax=Corynebacterium rouxii TaxID=2719119 RepID=A0A6I8MHA4_9CORY|nr:hypothetical protein [Corynebacterium rouxii]VZH86002.1 hypothetical protein FRC0190_01935 [Corynebacterium rouxii]
MTTLHGHCSLPMTKIFLVIGAVLTILVTILSSPYTAEAGERIHVDANGTAMTKMTEQELNGFLADRDLSISTDSGFEYDPGSAAGWYVEDTGVYISYNLIRDESLQFGTIGILFNKDGSTTQSEITAVGDKNGGVGKMWIDHQLVSDKSFSESDADDAMVPQSNAFLDSLIVCNLEEFLAGL